MFNRIVIVVAFFLFTCTSSFAQQQKRMEIKSVRFQGTTAFAERVLHKVIISRPSQLFARSYYFPNLYSDDLKALELFYKQNGYLDAKIENHEVRIDSTKKQVHITISMNEGDRTIIEGVDILGNTFFSDTLLSKKITVQADRPLKSTEVEASQKNLLTEYANKGFLDAKVQSDIRLNESTQRALVDFIITENAQYTINQISLEGLKKTNNNVVMREIKLKSGEIVNYFALLESQRNLYLTGLFQSVFVKPQPPANADSTQKDVIIEFKENSSVEFNTSVGYGTVERARGKLEIFDTNLRGSARKIGLSGSLSSINRNIELSFTEPWTFGVPMQTDVNLLSEFLEEPGYKVDRTRALITIGRRYKTHTNITLTYRQERAKLRDVKTSEIPDDLRSNIKSFRLSYIYDTRNNLFNPVQGNFFELSNELGGTFLSEVNGFYRVISRFKHFRRLPWSGTFGTGLEIGWINSQSALEKIPLQERFYTGGANSLRGFGYQEVGPRGENGTPTGGQLKVVWNVFELRKPLWKFFGAAFFTDTGNVWMSHKDFSFSEFRTNLGIGLRVDSPIGLARLDYGFNLDPKRLEKQGRFYFSIGHAF